MTTNRVSFLRRAALAVALSGAALAAFAQGLPQVQRSDGGNVEYITGGIGLGESQAMKAAASQWPLALEFAVTGSPRASYASDVDVTVLDARGNVVLKAVSEGPFLFARVEPGTYGVQATRQGVMKQRKVTVRSGKGTRAMFTWPAEGVDGPR